MLHAMGRCVLTANRQMIRRIFNTLSLISAILLACTVILWAWSFLDQPRKDCLSFSGDFHVRLLRWPHDFFSDKDGPYHGSIIALSSPKKPVERIFSKQQGFGDTLGIYYRYFRWADSGAVLWTLSVSLFYPMIVFAVLPAISLWSWRRRVTRFSVPFGKCSVPDRKCFRLSACIGGWAS